MAMPPSRSSGAVRKILPPGTAAPSGQRGTQGTSSSVLESARTLASAGRALEKLAKKNTLGPKSSVAHIEIETVKNLSNDGSDQRVLTKSISKNTIMDTSGPSARRDLDRMKRSICRAPAQTRGAGGIGGGYGSSRYSGIGAGRPQTAPSRAAPVCQRPSASARPSKMRAGPSGARTPSAQSMAAQQLQAERTRTPTSIRQFTQPQQAPAAVEEMSFEQWQKMREERNRQLGASVAGVLERLEKAQARSPVAQVCERPTEEDYLSDESIDINLKSFEDDEIFSSFEEIAPTLEPSYDEAEEERRDLAAQREQQKLMARLLGRSASDDDTDDSLDLFEYVTNDADEADLEYIPCLIDEAPELPEEPIPEYVPPEIIDDIDLNISPLQLYDVDAEEAAPVVCPKPKKGTAVPAQMKSKMAPKPRSMVGPRASAARQKPVVCPRPQPAAKPPPKTASRTAVTGRKSTTGMVCPPRKPPPPPVTKKTPAAKPSGGKYAYQFGAGRKLNAEQMRAKAMAMAAKQLKEEKARQEREAKKDVDQYIRERMEVGDLDEERMQADLERYKEYGLDMNAIFDENWTIEKLYEERERIQAAMRAKRDREIAELLEEDEPQVCPRRASPAQRAPSPAQVQAARMSPQRRPPGFASPAQLQAAYRGAREAEMQQQAAAVQEMREQIQDEMEQQAAVQQMREMQHEATIQQMQNQFEQQAACMSPAQQRQAQRQIQEQIRQSPGRVTPAAQVCPAPQAPKTAKVRRSLMPPGSIATAKRLVSPAAEQPMVCPAPKRSIAPPKRGIPPPMMSSTMMAPKASLPRAGLSRASLASQARRQQQQQQQQQMAMAAAVQEQQIQQQLEQQAVIQQAQACGLPTGPRPKARRSLMPPGTMARAAAPQQAPVCARPQPPAQVCPAPEVEPVPEVCPAPAKTRKGLVPPRKVASAMPAAPAPAAPTAAARKPVRPKSAVLPVSKYVKPQAKPVAARPSMAGSRMQQPKGKKGQKPVYYGPEPRPADYMSFVESLEEPVYYGPEIRPSGFMSFEDSFGAISEPSFVDDSLGSVFDGSCPYTRPPSFGTPAQYGPVTRPSDYFSPYAQPQYDAEQMVCPRPGLGVPPRESEYITPLMQRIPDMMPTSPQEQFLVQNASPGACVSVSQSPDGTKRVTEVKDGSGTLRYDREVIPGGEGATRDRLSMSYRTGPDTLQTKSFVKESGTPARPPPTERLVYTDPSAMRSLRGRSADRGHFTDPTGRVQRRHRERRVSPTTPGGVCPRQPRGMAGLGLGLGAGRRNLAESFGSPDTSMRPLRRRLQYTDSSFLDSSQLSTPGSTSRRSSPDRSMGPVCPRGPLRNVGELPADLLMPSDSPYYPDSSRDSISFDKSYFEGMEIRPSFAADPAWLDPAMYMSYKEMEGITAQKEAERAAARMLFKARPTHRDQMLMSSTMMPPKQRKYGPPEFGDLSGFADMSVIAHEKERRPMTYPRRLDMSRAQEADTTMASDFSGLSSLGDGMFDVTPMSFDSVADRSLSVRSRMSSYMQDSTGDESWQRDSEWQKISDTSESSPTEAEIDQSIKQIYEEADDQELDTPELIAARMNAESAGIHLTDETKEVLAKILPGGASLPAAISVVAVAPGPFEGAVVPMNAVTTAPFGHQAQDLEMAAMAVNAMPVTPRDDIISATLAGRSPRERQRKLKTKEELVGELGPESVKAFGDSKLFEITQLSEMVGASPSKPANILDEVQYTEEENEFMYPLQIRQPKRILRVQLRGSYTPSWFPGFYTQLPDKDEVGKFKEFLDVLSEAHDKMGPDVAKSSVHNISTIADIKH